MEHLNLEQLARLVDEPPTPEEKAFLDGDHRLRRELDALRQQTEALGDLPAVLPPPGGWHELEKKLVASGLIFARQGGPRVWRNWLQVAAAVVIFVGGGAIGWVTASAPTGVDSAGVSSGPASYASVEEAIATLDRATQQWVHAYGGLQQLMSDQGQQRRSRDPAVRLAALETLMASSRAAVEESPDDRFFNELWVRTMAERNQTILQLMDDWH